MNDLDKVGSVPSQTGSARRSCGRISYNLGIALHSAKRLDDAAKAYTKAMTAKPEFAEAILNLGHVLKSLGKEDEARACWSKALAVKPELIQ